MYRDHAYNSKGELRIHVIAAQRIGCSVEEYARNTAEGKAWCSYGQHWKPRIEFGTTSVGKRDSYCLECRKIYRH